MIENAIILAAGTGSRLKPLTDHAPKCLTEVNGVPILIKALENLSDIGINNCAIVTGYYSETVKNIIGNIYKGLNITYIYNRDYARTNDLYSLWLARDVMIKGFVLLEGDIFFLSETLEKALSQMDKNSCYIAGKYNGKQDEILLTSDSNGLIRDIEVLRGRAGETGRNKYMSTGLLIIQDIYGKLFSEWLTEFVNRKKIDVLFDDVLSAYVHYSPLYVHEIEWEDWVEIDTQEDLLEAERIFRANV